MLVDDSVVSESTEKCGGVCCWLLMNNTVILESAEKRGWVSCWLWVDNTMVDESTEKWVGVMSLHYKKL